LKRIEGINGSKFRGQGCWALFGCWRKTFRKRRGEGTSGERHKEAFVDGGDRIALENDAKFYLFSGVSRIWRDFFPTGLKQKSNPSRDMQKELP
jgi:hypothetical protein